MRLILSCICVLWMQGWALSQDLSTAAIDSLVIHGKKVYYASPQEALQIGNDIINYAESINYTEGRLEGIRLIGNSHYLMGRLDSATFYMLRLLEEAYKANHKGMQADVMIDIGQTYDKIGLHSLAFDYFKQAHEIRLEIGDPERLSVTLINLAYHYYLRDMLDTALVYYQKTEEILDTIELTFTKPFLYNERGGVYLKQGRIEEARSEINKAIALNIQMDNNWDLSYNYVMLADLEHKVGNNELAETYANKALTISKENQIALEYDAIYKILAEINQSQGHADHALEFLQKSYTYRDSLNLALTDQKLLALDHYKRMKENEIETLLLTNQNLEQESKILIQRYWLMITVIVLLFAVTVGIVLYHQKNRLVAAQRRIESQNQDLKHLNITKNKLFSIITHDIRNPLSHINGMLQLARDGMISGDEFKTYAGSLVDQTNRISSLSNTLINWSRSQETGFNAELEPLKIDELVNQALEYLRYMAEKKNISLVLKPPFEGTMVADRNMMLLVINNILTNAIKFTPQDGTVTLSISIDEEQISLHISDTGIGIEDEILTKLKSGMMESQIGTAGEKGSGIGLLLTLDLIAFQQGRLEVRRNQPAGSTFTITLPQAV